LEFRAEQGQAQFGVGIMLSNDLETIDSSTRVCNLVSAEGVSDPQTTPTVVDLDGAKYIRPAVFLKSVDGNLAGGAIAGVVELWA
jgi:hypothetical protein